MRILLAIALVLVGYAAQAEPRVLKNKNAQIFCRNEQDLLMYVVVVTNEQFKDREMPGCMVLRRRARYEVLDSAGVHRNNRVLRVRLSQRGEWIEGYVMKLGE